MEQVDAVQQGKNTEKGKEVNTIENSIHQRNWNVVKDMRVFSDPSKSKEGDVGSNKDTTVPEKIVSSQEINNGAIAGRIMQNDNSTTKEWIENSFFGHMPRVEAVEGTDVLEDVAEYEDQVIDSTESGENVKYVMLSIEVNEYKKKNVSDQQVNGNNDTEEMNLSSVIEKLEDQVGILEEERIEMHNKELEVVVESMTGDMMSHNDAQAIV
ncbi:hypothetical protein K7X08_025732 [Anisodus acutangulus]|uniref:Uncharacterized protein n=1 Tax=Anisodus acutangulus TaxID=402998 RepID=A0A9Q1L8X8_9SOLA|nr:hypothetical protein K7X08_025732 [Anisodus acutangulus]